MTQRPRPIATVRRGGDTLKEGGLAETILPYEDSPHPRRTVGSGEWDMDVAQKLDASYAQLAQVHASNLLPGGCQVALFLLLPS